jgi:serine/threonine-protein kinase
MLTGRVPFPAESREAVLAKHLTEPAPGVRTLVPDLAPETEAVVARCLSKGPADRYADATELLLALDAALAAVQAARGTASAVAPAQPPRAATAQPPAAPGQRGAAPRTRRQRRRGR